MGDRSITSSKGVPSDYLEHKANGSLASIYIPFLNCFRLLNSLNSIVTLFIIYSAPGVPHKFARSLRLEIT
jgi:hypothetical protein